MVLISSSHTGHNNGLYLDVMSRKAYNMKYKLLISLVFLVAVSFLKAETNLIDRSDIYTALSAEKLDLINAQIAAVKNSSLPEKHAYEGALLMKKSGLVKGAKEKLSIFKEGRAKLEAAIAKDNDNIEYRFLRLIIQEHAPKVVKYRSDIETDIQLIRTNYKTLTDFLQKTIADYARHSKALKLS